MAGHSQFKNIMHRKGRQDANKAKRFNKIAREISVASKGGAPDPAANPRLRAAVQAARAMNMARERIEKAIKAGQPGGGDGAVYEEIRYEGYGAGGIALIVEALTDNRNRTASDIRAAFSKHGGSLGETNSVGFLFQRCGLISYPEAIASADAMLEAVILAGGTDVSSGEAGHEVITNPEDIAIVRDALEKQFGAPSTARLTWKPLSLVAVDGEAAQLLLKLLDTLEDHDDVQHVIGNFDIAADALADIEV